MDFFDMVPDNFFSLLSSKNRRIYLASMLQVFQVYETGTILGIDKKIVVDDLVYFLDTNKQYLYDIEEKDLDDEEADPKSNRELANFILRKMEETGWIYVDVSNDYEEILNFSDVAITICEAILNAYPQIEYAEDDLPDNYVNPNEYQGYIYSIYSILSQTENVDYSLTFNLVYQDTRQLIRSIRRLDARMKDYITSVVSNNELKDLMEKLMDYKVNVYDAMYVKLKISDNIDRYRLGIITKLQEMQSDEVIINSIATNYLSVTHTHEEAVAKAVRNIDEVIDAFNALEEFIAEIDNKNRDYINSTIGKVKFLLSEDDNTIGKLNTILNFIKKSKKIDKIDRAMRIVEGLYNLPVYKIYDQERSLYQPRGGYQRNYNQMLDEVGIEGFEIDDEFMAQFKNNYNEDEIAKFLVSHTVDGEFRASDYITLDSTDEEFMMVVYCIIQASEKGYYFNILTDTIENEHYKMKNFVIKKTL